MTGHFFAGRLAVVTGAASGLGRELALELVSQGAELVLIDIDETVTDLAQSIGGIGLRCDVGDREQVERAARRIHELGSGIHALVNNAGVSAAGAFADMPATDFDWVMRTNFAGVVNGCRAFLPLIHRGGRIANVSSCFAWLGFPGKAAYSSSKAAVRAFSESLRAELAPQDIGVTLLFPGPLDTGLVKNGRSVDSRQQLAEAEFVAARALSTRRVAQRCLMGIRKNRARVVCGWDYRVLDALARLSPGLSSWVAQKAHVPY